MLRRQHSLTLLVTVLFQVQATSAATPELKRGVRLPLGASRLASWAAPEVVDWDKDGLNDLVVGYYSGSLAVYRNRGVGESGIRLEKVDIDRQDSFARNGVPIWAWRFNKASCVCPGPGRLSPRVVDWDDDGKKDLLIGDGVGAQIRIFQNVGTDPAPQFSTHHLQYLPPDAGVRPYHETVQPCFVDWNGDGRRDLLMGRNRGIYVYLNEGTNTSPQFAFERSRLGTKLRGVFPDERLCPVVTDWDADGKHDLVVGSQRGEVWFARNVGSKTQPQFKGFSPIPAGGKDIHVGLEARIAVGDLDGDAQDDLLVGTEDGLVWFFQAKQPKPVARSRYVQANRGKPTKLELVGTDDSERKLTYRVVTPPELGTLSGTAPDLTYTPGKKYDGRDQFTFQVVTGNVVSAPATMWIENEPAIESPGFKTQPADTLVGIGQTATFSFTMSGTPPITYQWRKNGQPIPDATAAEFTVNDAKLGDSGKYSVTVANSAGSVTSRAAMLDVKPFPAETANVPVIDIQFKSPAIEPSTPGVLTLVRTGKLDMPVTVNLTTRRGHTPVIADLHFVPVPSSVTLKAGQTTAEILVTPIDNTLTGGTESLTFLIDPSPAYRLARKICAARMTFLDDDCPDVGIGVLKSSGGGPPTFEVTATPAPSRDTQVVYSVGGTAVASVDFEPLPSVVTIPAGKTSATITIKPYRQAAGDSQLREPTQDGTKQADLKKSVVVTLAHQPFTYFEFYRYLAHSRPRTASAFIEASADDPFPPKPSPAASDPAVDRLRREVARLGWIVFTARSDGVNSDLDLFIVRPDGSHLRNITNTPQFDEHSARVSPDGRRMLYRRSPKADRVAVSNNSLPQDVGTVAMRTRPQAGALVIAEADGSNPKPVGGDGEYAWATWGPRGKLIACLEKVEAKAAAQPVDRRGQPKTSYELVIRDAKTMQVVKTIRSAGIHSQAVWSPDGKRICGSADMSPGTMPWSKGLAYPLGIGKIASLDIESGRRTAMSRFPDWGPVWATDTDADWFQGGSPQVLHSANNYRYCPAYYCMLWRSGLDEQASQLVYGEFKRHIWGGCTSPDDTYAVFVISGDTWPLAGRLAIIRLSDAPIARGRSTLFHEVLADYFPDLKQGPVLDLIDAPEGFEPHWTDADIGGDPSVERR